MPGEKKNEKNREKEMALGIICDKRGYERFSLLLPQALWQIPTSPNKVLLFSAVMAATGNDNPEVTFRFLIFLAP